MCESCCGAWPQSLIILCRLRLLCCARDSYKRSVAYIRVVADMSRQDFGVPAGSVECIPLSFTSHPLNLHHITHISPPVQLPGDIVKQISDQQVQVLPSRSFVVLWYDANHMNVKVVCTSIIAHSCSPVPLQTSR